MLAIYPWGLGCYGGGCRRNGANSFIQHFGSSVMHIIAARELLYTPSNLLLECEDTSENDSMVLWTRSKKCRGRGDNTLAVRTMQGTIAEGSTDHFSITSSTGKTSWSSIRTSALIRKPIVRKRLASFLFRSLTLIYQASRDVTAGLRTRTGLAVCAR